MYAGTGTINTSDGRTKQDIQSISEAENRVAVALKKQIRSFRFKDAVIEKGDSARVHFGVIAQDVAAEFVKEGLDPNKYGLFCYDEWEEQQEIWDGVKGVLIQQYIPAGNRFGIRYEELLAFIISAI